MKTRPAPPSAISVVTLGCSKNTVDSEELMAQIDANGLRLVEQPADADIVIINTCGFIDAAKEESVNTILEAVEMKRQGTLRSVYVAGCLSERYHDELAEQIPEVDRFFGVTDFRGIVEALGGQYRRELLGERHLTQPSHSAYLKISEGCDNPCSFCAIPLMRGGHVSKPIEQVVHEAKYLAELGTRELVIIGQDTTYYGLDLYGSRDLARLLRELARVRGIEWIRLMYAFPAQFPLDVLDVIRDEPTVCAYLDMPVQHVADPVLKSMRRGITRARTEQLIETIRSTVPGITLRTTLIVGYPAETDQAFDELMDFVRTTEFDRLGVFTYSQEEKTTAEVLGDPVPASLKEERRAEIMHLQSAISARKNEGLRGKTLRVLVDRMEGGLLIGRTDADAPEVDNEVLIDTGGNPDPALIGEFVDVTIHDTSEFDLYGSLSR